MKLSRVIIIVVVGLTLFYIVRFNMDGTLTKKDLPGTYVYNSQKNTFDTLLIFNNGKYVEKLYDKNRKLIAVRNSFWNSKKDLTNNFALRVHFTNMILNDDRKISASRNYNNSKMSLSTGVIQDNGTIKIKMNSDLGFYFIKQ